MCIRDRFIGAAKRITPEREDALLRRIAEELPGGHAKDGDVLIDYPLKKRFQAMDDAPGKSTEGINRTDIPPMWVLRRQKVSKRQEAWVPIEVESPLVKRLGLIEDQISRRIRVYVSRELLARESVRQRIEQGGDQRIETIVTETIRSWRDKDLTSGTP